VATNLTGEMTLSWDPSQIKGYRAVLTDGAQKIDMKKTSSYSYNSGGGQKTWTVELTGKESAPSQNTLLQNFPNPFNPECWIPFKLSEPADHVEFRIYTITGQLIRTIDCGPRDDSDHVKKCGNNESNKENGCACFWDGYNNRGQEVASGVYFYQLVADGKVLTKKMVVLK
ncbi:hypothetical protein KKG61_06340, partial [bacterium]|nr:hypothetical protein [bacterium]